MATEPILQLYDERMYSPVHREYYNQSDFFNWGYWSPETRTQQEASENLVEQLLAFLPSRSGTILDVACGKGATTRYLLRWYPPAAVMGINISAKQLETGRLNAPECQFLGMDAAHLAFADATFDTLICVEAAFHFNTRERFLQEAYRVLKPGGHLVLSDIAFSRLANLGSKLMPKANVIQDLNSYRTLYQKAGFRDVDIVNATEQVWHPFRRYMLRWAREKVITGDINVLEFAVFVFRFLLAGPVVVRHYLLACARKA